MKEEITCESCNKLINGPYVTVTSHNGSKCNKCFDCISQEEMNSDNLDDDEWYSIG